MVEEKRSVMKYIRNYETEEKFLADKDSTSRGFRLKSTLYKYSDESEDEDNRDHIYLELDDPRKHEGSTYMEIALSSDVEFSYYIGNAPEDTQTTMTCTIDWGDGTVETKTITKDDKGFKLSHSYTAGSYKIELYGVERDYSVVGDTVSYKTLISHPSSAKRVVLGERVSSIGCSMFSGCSSLKTVYIPEGVNSIESNAFRSCTSLASIHIPESVTRIEEQAFYGCTSLTSVHIPEGVTSIDSWTFRACSSLKTVYIPEGVNSIESNAFGACSSLRSIYIPESVIRMNNNVFYHCSSLETVYIPESVTIIGSNMFQDCTSLKSIDIPKKVTSIGHDAFYKCTSLKSIDIPEKVTSIGDSAFKDCTSLTSISSFNLTTPTLGGNIFLNLPTNGTLHIKPGATGYDAWLSKLPEGWRIVEDL